MDILRKAKWKFDKNMEVILAEIGGVEPFVVWIMDPETKQRYWGAYFSNINDAIENFNERSGGENI